MAELESGYVTFGTCKKCEMIPATFYPIILCDNCHKEFANIGGEPGSDDRRERVKAFFNE